MDTLVILGRVEERALQEKQSVARKVTGIPSDYVQCRGVA